MTEQRTYPDAHRFTASRPDGVVCIAQRAALTPGVCGYPAGHPIHAAPAKHPASSSATKVDTPAEALEEAERLTLRFRRVRALQVGGKTVSEIIDILHAEALDEDDARYVAGGRALLGWKPEDGTERERQATRAFVEAMNAASTSTPAERITGISDRRAAALVDLAELQRMIVAVVVPRHDDRSAIREHLARIGAALREGEAR